MSKDQEGGLDQLLVPIYVDPDGNAVGVEEVFTKLEAARKHEDEVLVFLVAHEAFHYLRKTKQVAGRHGEIEADAFALQVLEQYREESDTW